MPEAKIIDVCEAIVTALAAAWVPVEPDTCEFDFIAPVSIDDLDSFLGRKVTVFPGPQEDDGENRGEDKLDMTIGVLAVERYTDAGDPSKAWMKERLYWMENTIKGTIKNYRRTPLVIGARRIRLQGPIAIETFELRARNESKIFWSELEFKMIEVG